MLRLSSSYRSALLGVLSLLLGSSLARAAYIETINAVTITSGDTVIAADATYGGAAYNRETIRLDTNVTFSGSGTVTYRYDYQLLDDSGATVLLDNGTGGTTTTFQGESFVISGPLSKLGSEELVPAAQLDPGRQYRVRLLVKEQGSPFYVTTAQQDTAAQSFIHFLNTDPDDAPFNVLVRTNSVSWQKRWALDTDADPDNQKLRLQVNLTLWRYDDFDAASAGSNPIPVRINYQLREAGTGTVVATAAAFGDTSLDMDEFAIDVIKVPYERTVSVNFRPDPAVQLASYSKQYYVTASIEHQETTGGAWQPYGTPLDSPAATVLHYNGTLTASGDSVVMSSITNDPAAAGVTDLGGHWLTSPFIDAGYAAAKPEWLVDGNQQYSVHLFDDGHAEFVDATALTVTPPATPDVGTINSLRFLRANTTFASSGFRSNLTLLLPNGLGYYVKSSDSLPDYALSAQLTTTNRALDDQLRPTATSITFGLPGTAGSTSAYFLVEETKPVEIAAMSIIWDIANGEIEPGPAPSFTDRVRYRRATELAALDASTLPADDKIVRSNEAYYQHVAGTAGTTPPVFTTGPLGSARMDATIDLLPGSFRSHFPHDASVTWNSPGAVTIDNDLVVPSGSSVGTLAPVELNYARDCEEFADCGTIGDATVKLDPGVNPLVFTRDGGCGTGGTLLLAGSRRDIVAGYIDALSSTSLTVHAHDTSIFLNGRFLMAGHFLAGGDFTATRDSGPGRLLNSGFDPANYNTPERPGSTAYTDGLGDYPGMNYRVAAESAPPTAISVLGGVPTPSYTLGPRAKYYTRKGGVTGIHEPTANPFSGPVTIYGYQFTFSSFGLSFMDSEVHDTITAGSVDIPYPSDFTLAFDKLWFNCIGGLTTAEIAGGTLDANLPFWDADISASAASFQPAAGAGCDPSDAYLVLGCQAWASNITTPLFGNLGFHPSGNLVTAADGVLEGVDSRLSIPNNATIAGPNGESYPLHALHDAYLDNYDHAADTGAGAGRINLLGNLGVAFFEDLDVHLRTGANEGNTTDPIELTGGWTDGAATAFDAADWDLDNYGRPAAETLAAYLTPGAHPAHARQDWIGIVEFDYPLVWSTTTRSFRAEAPVANDLLVLATEHECTYLSAETAELDFGANVRLDLPEINLSNISTNALEGTGVLEALTRSLAEEGTNVLLNGLDSSAELLNDRMDEFYDRVFETTVDPLVDDLYDQLALAPDYAAMETLVNDYLCDPVNGIAGRLEDLDGFVGKTGSIVDEVDQALARMQMAIRTVIGRVQVDASGNVVIDTGEITVPEEYVVVAGTTLVEGIFADAEGDGYDIAEVLAVALLEELAPDIADGLSAALTDIAGSLADKLEEELDARFNEMGPTLEQVKQVLLELHNAIQQIRNAGDLYDEIGVAVTGASGEIADFMEDAKDEVLAFLATIDLDEYTADEVKQIIRQAIRDQFNASAMIAGVQVALKGYIYDIDAAVNEAISSGFAELNRLLTGLLDDLVPMDSALQGMLDDLADISAAGQIDGYAQINGDALRTLRLDAAFQFQLPDPFEINGYLEINQLDSEGDGSCSFAGEGQYAAEVKLGATDIPARWLGDDLRFSIETKFTFDTAAGFALRGMGGSFEMTEGEIAIETMAVTSLGAAAAFGLDENYLAAQVGLRFESYALAGGVFFGRTCSLAPLELVDPLVASVLGPAPFTGFYGYGEVQIPIINYSCLFRLSAKAGIGVFYFQEGPTYGGKMLLGASGEALCAVEVGGEITLVGAKSGNDYSYLGKGKVYGSVGVKPLKVSFDETVTISYKNNKWDYDY